MFCPTSYNNIQLKLTDLSNLQAIIGNRQGVKSQDLETLRRLIAAGCDIEATDDEGTSLMHVLFERRSHEFPCYEELVDLLFVEKMVSTPRKDGILILPLAIRARHPADIIRRLIPSDLSLWNGKDDRKFTALHELVCPRPFIVPGARAPTVQSCSNDDFYMTQILDVLLEVEGVDINVKDQQGSTPLLTAAWNCTGTPNPSRASIFKKLLEKGANIHAQNDYGWGVLHFLVIRGFNLGLLEVLKFKPDVNMVNSLGNTPLHVAIGSNTDQSASVRLLL